jgi:hypothetical protein
MAMRNWSVYGMSQPVWQGISFMFLIQPGIRDILDEVFSCYQPLIAWKDFTEFSRHKSSRTYRRDILSLGTTNFHWYHSTTISRGYNCMKHAQLSVITQLLLLFAMCKMTPTLKSFNGNMLWMSIQIWGNYFKRKSIIYCKVNGNINNDSLSDSDQMIYWTLTKVCLMCTAFWKLILLPSWGEWLPLYKALYSICIQKCLIISTKQEKGKDASLDDL